MTQEFSIEAHPRFTELTQLGKYVRPLLHTMWRISNDRSTETPRFRWRDIEQASGLSMNQIRYTLAPLMNANMVAMSGGQSTHSTSYSFTAPFVNELVSD